MIDQINIAEDINMWAVIALMVSVGSGLLIHIKPFWFARTATATLTTCLIGASLGLILISDFPVWFVVVVTVLQLYRLFSLLRVFKNRIHDSALRARSLRSETVFIILIFAAFGVVYIDEQALLRFGSLLAALASLQVVASLVFLIHSRQMEKITRAYLPKKYLSDAELPTITVAVPARNETDDLNDCLVTVLQSDYPKLEVLVLDDCSQDNTSEIIKAFAHRGVRFIEGRVPPPSWLAKNYAYHQLLEESEGKLVLFCGTDARFEKNSIRLMVESLLHSKKLMLSVLPVRRSGFDSHYLLQPIRYWRELAIPKILDRTPPVLSTCWLADRKYLLQHGGFEAHKKSVRPEKVVARIARTESMYSFVRATSGLGVYSAKDVKAQWNTAVRTRYPEHKNRPENILVGSFGHVLLLFSPGIIAIYSFFSGHALALLLSLFAAAVLLATHNNINRMASGKFSIVRLVIFPLSVLMELAVMNYSMWAYEFHEVTWKGRNVCLPVLQGNLRLPKA